MAKKIRYGIIGTGGMANSHAIQFKSMKGVELAACLDVVPGRAEAFAKTHGFKHPTNHMADFFNEVDALSIVTPDSSHAELTLKSLKAGKHVLCEKPLTTNLADAKKVAKAAKAASRKGQIHLINFSYRNAAAFYEAQKIVQRGDLGEIRHVQGRYLQSWLASDMWGDWTVGDKWMWRLQTSRGSNGVLGGLGCHILDFTTGVAGEVKAMRCTTSTFEKIDTKDKKYTKWKGVPLDANDSFAVQLEFANGALGMVDASRWASGFANTVMLMVHGTDGALSVNLDEGYTLVKTCLGKDRHKCLWKSRTVKATPTNYQRFIRSIQTGKQDMADLLRGAEVQAYLDACDRSLVDGKWAKIKSWK